MQIIFDNFKVISGYKLKFYLNPGEICIKNISNKDEKLYGRTYTYKNFGCIEINDRLLPIGLKTEIIDTKHKLTIYECNI